MYPCAFSDEGDHQAQFIFTSLTNGQTQASCTEHMPVFLIGALAAELDVDGQKFYDAVRRHADREHKKREIAEQAAFAPDPVSDGQPADPEPEPAEAEL